MFFLLCVVFFSSSVSRCDIGEVLPCNGGVRKNAYKQSTPSACSHSPYIFFTENTGGEKVTLFLFPPLLDRDRGGVALQRRG